MMAMYGTSLQSCPLARMTLRGNSIPATVPFFSISGDPARTLHAPAKSSAAMWK